MAMIECWGNHAQEHGADGKQFWVVPVPCYQKCGSKTAELKRCPKPILLTGWLLISCQGRSCAFLFSQHQGRIKGWGGSSQGERRKCCGIQKKVQNKETLRRLLGCWAGNVTSDLWLFFCTHLHTYASPQPLHILQLQFPQETGETKLHTLCPCNHITMPCNLRLGAAQLTWLHHFSSH